MDGRVGGDPALVVSKGPRWRHRTNIREERVNDIAIEGREREKDPMNSIAPAKLLLPSAF